LKLTAACVLLLSASLSAADPPAEPRPVKPCNIQTGVESGLYATNLWHNGIIPYEFDDNVDATNRVRALRAMGDIEEVSAIDFVARCVENDFLHLIDSGENSSWVGKRGGNLDVQTYNGPGRLIVLHDPMDALRVWDGEAWLLRANTGPTPRLWHAMAYDSARGVTVLFGGYDGSYRGDTWEWNGQTWSLRANTGPTPRHSHAMAYDSTRRVTVLFSGYDGSYRGDTWEWDGQKWSLRANTGPTPRHWHAMAYDSARGVTVLFGGYDGSYRGDTWEWDGQTWSLRATCGPSPRINHAMTYDASRGVTVLFGGYDGNDNGETWEWVRQRWTRRSNTGPSPRHWHAIAYDSARGVTVLFGGLEAGDVDGETWEYRATDAPCPRDPEWGCNGDVDGNGAVNPVDVGVVQAAFCTLGECCPDALCQCDLDCNGVINPVDVGIVQSLFGTCDPPRDPCL
jgi:hypothetical protein